MLLAKYPENELVQETLKWKKRMKDSQLHGQTSNLVVSRRRYAEDLKNIW